VQCSKSNDKGGQIDCKNHVLLQEAAEASCIYENEIFYHIIQRTGACSPFL
jgi:hypothetical protein